MNELGWDESDGFIGSDTTKVEKHIEKVFTDAWRKCVDLFSVFYFTVRPLPPHVELSNGTGYVILPDDFYKLVSFKMKGWQRPTEMLHDRNDAIGSIQSNEYVRGSVCRPVCVREKERIKRREGDQFVYDIKDVLRYYSLPPGAKHEVEEALYIPLEGPLSEDTIISDILFDPLAYVCASMVFNIFDKPEIAKALMANAVEIAR